LVCAKKKVNTDELNVKKCDLYPQNIHVYVLCSILYLHQVKALDQNIYGGYLYVWNELNLVWKKGLIGNT